VAAADDGVSPVAQESEEQRGEKDQKAEGRGREQMPQREEPRD